MKIVVHMKDPDTMLDAVKDAVRLSVSPLGLKPSEAAALEEVREEIQRKKMRKWFKYSEYLSVEFDTDAGTARVLTVDEAKL